MLGKSNKWLVLSLSLFILTVANAAPTIGNRSVPTCVISPDTNRDSFVPEIIQITESINSHLAAAGAEFLKPPADFTYSSDLPADARSLPAVPGTLFMVLTGFVCVSLVKDRKVWLAATAGLLWAGQTGIQALPQLALRLSHINHSNQQLLHPELTYCHCLEDHSRLRSDIEGTRYIGLLRHLAGIPDAKSALTNEDVDRLITLSSSAVIPEQYNLNLQTNHLAVKAELFIYFSPAFIFENLPRGPPEPT